MHEMAVTENIVRIVEAEARRAGAARVSKITLVIGELSSIVDDSVQMYFDAISEGTLAQGAKLEFKRIPATLRCPECAHVFSKEGARFECPLCGKLGKLTGGAQEFYIESMEILTPEEVAHEDKSDEADNGRQPGDCR